MLVPLTNGGFAIIDAKSWPKVRGRSWHRDQRGGYVVSGGGRHTIRLNPLNNRMRNLRVATRSNNNANGRKRSGTSRFKGVCWNKQRNAWRAQIQVRGHNITVGDFREERSAARAYDKTAKFARTNRMLGLL